MNYSEILVKIDSASVPILTWNLSAQDLSRSEKGFCVNSPSFNINGLADTLHVAFYPAGSILAKADRASVYVCRDSACAGAVSSTHSSRADLSLYVDGKTKTFKGKSLADSFGWANFMSRRTKYKRMCIYDAAASPSDESNEDALGEYIGCQIFASQNVCTKLSLLDSALDSVDFSPLLSTLETLAGDRSKQVMQRASDLLRGLRVGAGIFRAQEQARSAEAALRAAVLDPVSWARSTLEPPPAPVPCSARTQLRVVLRDERGRSVSHPGVRAAAIGLLSVAGGPVAADAIFRDDGGEHAVLDFVAPAAPGSISIKARLGRDGPHVGRAITVRVLARQPKSLSVEKLGGGSAPAAVWAGDVWEGRLRIMDNFGDTWRCAPAALQVHVARSGGGPGLTFPVAVAAVETGLGKRRWSAASSSAAAADEFALSLATGGLARGRYVLHVTTAEGCGDDEVRLCDDGEAVEVGWDRDPRRWSPADVADFMLRCLADNIYVRQGPYVSN